MVNMTIFGSCKKPYQEHPDFILIGEQNGYYSMVSESGILEERFGLKFKLIPKRDYNKPIYLMACSWDDYAMINNTGFYLGTPCDRNYLTWVSLRENEYLELNTTVGRKVQAHNSSYKLRLALLAVDTAELNFESHLLGRANELKNVVADLKTQKERLIWSNEIELLQLGKSEPLPFGEWTKRKELP